MKLFCNLSLKVNSLILNPRTMLSIFNYMLCSVMCYISNDLYLMIFKQVFENANEVELAV